MTVRARDRPRIPGRIRQYSRRHCEAGLVSGVVAAVEYRGLIGAALNHPLTGRMVVAVRIAEGAGLQSQGQRLVGGLVSRRLVGRHIRRAVGWRWWRQCREGRRHRGWALSAMIVRVSDRPRI